MAEQQQGDEPWNDPNRLPVTHDPVVENQPRVMRFGRQGPDAPDSPPIHRSPEELAVWWLAKADSEVRPMVEKMLEYGGSGRALDLEEIGRGLVHSGIIVAPEFLGPDGEPSPGHLQELGIYFYLLGKFARWTAAVAEGRKVSDDTLLDIGVYVRMAQRVREAGGWPQ